MKNFGEKFLRGFFLSLLILDILFLLVFLQSALPGEREVLITFVILAVIFFILFYIADKDLQHKQKVNAQVDNHLEDQTKKNQELSPELEKLLTENQDLKNELTMLKFSIKNGKRTNSTLDDSISAKRKKLNELQKDIRDMEKIINLKDYKKELEAEIKLLNSDAVIASSEIFVPERFTADEYKNKLSICKLKQKDLVRENKATKIINAISPSTKKAMTDNIKQILRCFNAECEIICSVVTVGNIDTKRSKMTKSFEILNKIFSVDGVQLTQEYLELKLEELHLYFSYSQQNLIEKEQQRAAREQLLEEEKVRREIEQEKKKIEKEEHQFKNEISKLMKYMQKANDIEKQLYIDKINELEEKLKLVEKDRENVLEREQNTRAGYVYVISNIGSFGENIFKIGMTRRLEPMDRIKELGDASVPFPFDVHALIFSEDAPALETILHQTFRKYEVNKVNTRKEFFRLPINEIEEVVRKNHNATVNFITIPKAEQYWASQEIEKEYNEDLKMAENL